MSLLGWRAAFFFNVPAAAIVLAVTPFVISESVAAERVKVDVPGAVTVTGGLLAVVYAVMEGSPLAGIVGVLLLVAFCVIELRSPAPLVPVRILRLPSVMWGNGAGLVVSAMEPAMIFLTTLYVQQVLGLSPLATGIVFGVPGLASVAAGVMAGRVIGRFGGRRVLAVSIAVQGLGAIAATQAVHLTGMHLALSFDVVLTVTAALLIDLALRPRTGVVLMGSRSGRNLVEMPR